MSDTTLLASTTAKTSAAPLVDADILRIVRSTTSYKATMANVATYVAGAMGALAVTAATIELGHAGDTTISRVSAGRIAVEGSNVIMASDIGVSVQAYDADLTAWAGVNPSSYSTTSQIAAAYQPLGSDLTAIEALASTGLAVRSAANTWVQRSIAGTANEITATNGDGVSANPTLSLPSALTFTGKTVTGGTFASPTLSGTVAGGPTASGVWTFSSLGAQMVRGAAGTTAVYERWTNTGGNYYFGVESSTGGTLISGASAYALAIVTESARDINFATNNTSRMIISAAGAVTIGGVAVPTISSSDTLSNKTIASPVMSGTWSGSPTFSGTPTFGGGVLTITSASAPRLQIIDTDAGSNNTTSWIYNEGTQTVIALINDALNSSSTPFVINRSGITANSIALTATTVTINGTAIASAAFKATGTSGNTVPLLDGANTWSGIQIFPNTTTIAAADGTIFSIKATSGGSDEKNWGSYMNVATKQFFWGMCWNDNFSSGNAAMAFTRSGTTPTLLNITTTALQFNGNAVACAGGATGGTGSAGAGKQYVPVTIGGTTYKLLYDT